MAGIRVARLLVIVALSAAGPSVSAQLGTANARGVSIGHVHLTVRDPAGHQKLWQLIGAGVARSGSLDLLTFPGLFVALTQGTAADGSEGSTVNHFGFAVRNVDEIRAKLSAAGLPTVQELVNPKRWVTMFPDNVKVEFVEVPALPVPIAGHHLHISTTDMEPLRAWYVNTFGGASETRRGFPSAVFDGGEVDMIQAQTPQAPTKGRALDHIGFEVKDLAAFCKDLEARGVAFEAPCSQAPEAGVKRAFLTDPIGTRIEITEGLASVSANTTTSR
jgi:catechol 2,3-dioxygenase-like lactoylglutathione lyase family enzyme